jgi:hypothetical protein
MSSIRPRTTTPEGHFETAPAAAAEPRGRTPARLIRAAGLASATLGIALLIAFAAVIGAALLLAGIIAAVIGDYWLTRLPRGGIGYGCRPRYADHHGGSYFHTSGFDCGFGDGGGDGG